MDTADAMEFLVAPVYMAPHCFSRLSRATGFYVTGYYGVRLVALACPVVFGAGGLVGCLSLLTMRHIC